MNSFTVRKAMLLLLTVTCSEFPVQVTCLHSHNTCSEPGWFGGSCNFQCHCQGGDNYCDKITGECSQGCHVGWFGPACQYSSSTYTVRPPEYSWIKETSENDTCSSPLPNSIKLHLDNAHPFTWLRATTRLSDEKDYIRPKFKVYAERNDGFITLECPKKVHFVPDAERRSFDIYCRTSRSVYSLVLSGPLVPYICSVRISAGRNMALKQPTDLPNEDPAMPSDRAVDGFVTSDTPGRTVCTATKPDVKPATLTLTMGRPFRVTKVVLHSHTDKAKREQLRGFILQIFSAGNQRFKFANNKSAPVQEKYVLVPGSHPKKPVQHQLKLVNAAPSTMLTFCELEVFGDSYCRGIRFGRNCELACNCAKGPCQVATGYCYESGCKAGFTGIYCQKKCPLHKYGTNCSQTCSDKCRDRICNHATGKCYCETDTTGDFCIDDKPQSTGRFGGSSTLLAIFTTSVFFIIASVVIGAAVKSNIESRVAKSTTELDAPGAPLQRVMSVATSTVGVNALSQDSIPKMTSMRRFLDENLSPKSRARSLAASIHNLDVGSPSLTSGREVTPHSSVDPVSTSEGQSNVTSSYKKDHIMTFAMVEEIQPE